MTTIIRLGLAVSIAGPMAPRVGPAPHKARIDFIDEWLALQRSRP